MAALALAGPLLPLLAPLPLIGPAALTLVTVSPILFLLTILILAGLWGYAIYLAWENNPDDRALHVSMAVLFGPIYMAYRSIRYGLDGLRP